MNQELVLAAALAGVIAGGPVPLKAGEEGAMPALVANYGRIFPALAKLSGVVWESPVPYSKIPVLAYDLVAGEEYLLNFPAAPPDGYVATPCLVNDRTVYRKEGPLTLGYAGGQCCRLVGGEPVVTMGYGRQTPAIDLLRSMLHEGFHYYQYAPLVPSGADDAISRGKRALFTGIPRDLGYDKLLVAEARLLYELTRETSPPDVTPEELSRLAAVNSLRKGLLSAETAFGEDSQLLLEGTAVYAELKGLRAVAEGTVELTGAGISSSAAKAEHEAYKRHYGPEMLANQINLTTLANGELVYRYAVAYAAVLEKLGRSWQKGLFPLTGEQLEPKEAMEAELRRNVSARSFSAMLAAQAGPPGKTPAEFWKEIESGYFSGQDLEAMAEKLRIEQQIDAFPCGPGWTYKVEAGQVVYPYFDYTRGKMYTGNKGTAAYLSGLARLDTRDKRLAITGISVPVVSNMFLGFMRFQDNSRSSGGDALVCEDGNGARCGRARLEIPGLKLEAVDVLITSDQKARVTVLSLGHDKK